MNERVSRYLSNRGFTACGRPTRDRFVKDSSANPPTLKKVGETDQQALIDSFKNECDVERIVARFQAGDASVLQRAQGLFYDATNFANEFTEQMNVAALAKQFWENASDEARSQFGSLEAYIDAFVKSNLPDQPSSDEAPEEVSSDEGGAV